METVHWTLSLRCEEDRAKIELLSSRGRLLRATTVMGRTVCWEYELEGAHRRNGEPVLITAWVGC